MVNEQCHASISAGSWRQTLMSILIGVVDGNPIEGTGNIVRILGVLAGSGYLLCHLLCSAEAKLIDYIALIQLAQYDVVPAYQTSSTYVHVDAHDVWRSRGFPKIRSLRFRPAFDVVLIGLVMYHCTDACRVREAEYEKLR